MLTFALPHMPFIRIAAFVLLLCCAGAVSPAAQAAVRPADYGVDSFPDSRALAQGTALLMDSLVRHHPMNSGRIVVGISPERAMTDNTADFYLLLLIFLLLGLIRLQNPRYFHALIRVFVNPAAGSRQVNEQLQAARMSNFLMNLFFAISAGAYLYYVMQAFLPSSPAPAVAPGVWMLLLIAGVMVVYLAKYLVIRLSGWAFRIETLTGHYLFNVFLVNKIIAVALLPFIVLLAFGDAAWVQPVVIVSLAAAGLLLLNRYLRSWEVFGSFFQYSRFHFFMYLCASELLPLAVLMKLAVRWML